MNLRDVCLGVEDPVDALLAFHRRIERALAGLGALNARLETSGVDAEASAAAAFALTFFSASIALHHADETDLLALLDTRLGSAREREEFDDLRQRLESEHRQMDATWRPLRRALDAIAEGMHRRLPPDLLHYFRALHGGHIADEEATLQLLAARNLRPSDSVALAHGMAARRSRNHRFR